MADSTTPENIPASAVDAAAIYTDGEFVWPHSQAERFDHVIRISVLHGEPGQAQWARALDVETFDATPADVGPFIEARRSFGHDDATIYCNRSNLAAVAEAAAGQPFRIWLATLDGNRFKPSDGFWAVQYRPAIVGQHYDLSIVYGERDFSHVHPAEAARIHYIDRLASAAAAPPLGQVLTVSR